ncbi:PspA/IM30 family protein [Bacillus sp. EAC]|uniref:PspA/IM30 family protein n=1 Tax=Bacillus sp. EAC TaxID=1978338 RepID=UPI000B43C4C1|nr:PspA/IM30 family protein [Bacillus sp. EAC]
MKNLFTRIKNQISADLHGLLDEKEQQNPISQLNYFIKQSESELSKVRALLERHYSLRTKFQVERESAIQMMIKREEQLKVATEAGSEELIKRASDDVNFYKEQAEKFATLITKTEDEVNFMHEQVNQIEKKLKELHTKKYDLMSRQNMAHATKKINETHHLLNSKMPSIDFNYFEKQIRDLELRVRSEFDLQSFDYKIEQLKKDLQNGFKKEA